MDGKEKPRPAHCPSLLFHHPVWRWWSATLYWPPCVTLQMVPPARASIALQVAMIPVSVCCPTWSSRLKTLACLAWLLTEPKDSVPAVLTSFPYSHTPASFPEVLVLVRATPAYRTPLSQDLRNAPSFPIPTCLQPSVPGPW